MMSAFALFLVLAVLVGCGLLLAIWWSEHAAPIERVEVRFGTDVSETAIAALLSSITGMPLASRLTFDVVGGEDGIRHFVGGSRADLEMFEAGFGGLLPGSHLVPLQDGDKLDEGGFTEGVIFRFRGPARHVLLRTDQASECATGLLAAISGPLGQHERFLLRVRLRPIRMPRLPQVSANRKPSDRPPAWFGVGAPRLSAKASAALANKYSRRPLGVTVLAAAKTDDPSRSWSLLTRLSSLIRSRQGLIGQISAARLRGRRLAQSLVSGAALQRVSVLTVDEVIGLLAWPVGSPTISGLQMGAAPLVAPSRHLPSTGRVVAVSNAPGHRDRPLAQPIVGGLQHLAVIGNTGSGKSTLALNLAVQDLIAGRGLLVLDLKGDLVNDLLRLIPEDRIDDVIVLDPSSGDPQPGLQLFRGDIGAQDAELTADLVLGTLRELFKEAWGVRTDQLLRLGLLTLANLPGASLPMLPRLFADPKLRTQALANADDPWLSSTWQRFDAMSQAEQIQQLAAPISRLEQLVGRKSLRHVLGQAESRLDVGDALAQNKIVLVRLPQGLLGRPTTQLLASLTLWQFFTAVEARAGMESHARTPFFAYIDEVSALGNLPLPLGDLLERARGFGVGITLLPQSMSQLPQELRRVLSANVGSVVSFRQPSIDEARAVSGLLTGITPEQLQNLDQFAVAMRLGLGPGNTSSLMTGTTVRPPEMTSSSKGVRRASAERYGRTLAEVDKGLTPRLKNREISAAPSAIDGDVALPGQRRRAQ